MKGDLLTEIENEIKEKQYILNNFMSQDNVDKDMAMILSIELDELISKYYKIRYSNKEEHISL